MSLPCVLLFGSLARGDSNGDSDIDLLISDNSKSTYSRKINNLEIQYTPQDKLTEMARCGDLFAVHLAYEASVISDPSRFFQDFKSELIIRKNYDVERRHALSLAAFLRKRKAIGPHQALRNKRIAWCVRTVLISLLMEQGRIIFAPDKLLELFPQSYLSDLISLRRGKADGNYRLIELDQFLQEFGGNEYMSLSLQQLRTLFDKSCNGVAKATVKSLSKSHHPEPLNNTVYANLG